MTQRKKKVSDGPGSAPSIVQEFTIEGLYGYRTVSLSSEFAATILIAKNGSGKTTLLGALDAFLRGHFVRLSSLQFRVITCKLRGVEKALKLAYEDLLAYTSIPEMGDFLSYARRYALEPTMLLNFIECEYDPRRKASATIRENEVFSKIVQKSGYSSVEARKVCDLILETLAGRVPAIDEIKAALRTALGDCEVVYLPTYRRVELSLGSEPEEEERLAPGIRKRPSIQNRLGLTRRGLFNTDIQFGLDDISERLVELNQELLFNSTQSYREISARIINDLLDGTLEQEGVDAVQKPDKTSLSLFFSRLREGRRYGPRFSDITIPEIDKIYNEGASTPQSNIFLNYFLGKLNTVINATRGIETMVEDFIDHCNTYLAGRDPSVEMKSVKKVKDFLRDDKRLVLDRKNLKVKVVSVATNRKILLDSLSSGEKQMISLFARLYLYPGPKIILIDEPELSLSIGWQRQILLDVVSAPTCSQVVAITHSPFVFDNELEPYARPLLLRIEPNVDSSQAVDEDGEVEDGFSE